MKINCISQKEKSLCFAVINTFQTYKMCAANKCHVQTIFTKKLPIFSHIYTFAHYPTNGHQIDFKYFRPFLHYANNRIARS